MSNREACVALIDGFDEVQLSGVFAVLKSIKDTFDNALEEALDEAYCQKLYQDYLDDPDPEKDETIPIEELAESLGIKLS